MDEVKKKVDYLDADERERHANLPASKTDLGKLWEKLEDMENRSRCNNVCFIGIPEGKEGRDAVKFLEELIPKLLEIQGKHETERMHRVTSQQPRPEYKPRPLLAKFLRSSDRDSVI